MRTTTSEPEPETLTRYWTRAEYYAMIDLGFFEGQHVELLDGEIVMTAGQKYSHTSSTSKVARVVRDAFGKGYWTRVQFPLQLANNSEPEPDVSVVLGTEDDYDDHPSSAFLVVEVSGTTLKTDRTRKAAIYARAGFEDYWIVNLFSRCVEVHRKPKKDAAGNFFYKSIVLIDEAGFVSPLAKPGAKIAVADLLPLQKPLVTK